MMDGNDAAVRSVPSSVPNNGSDGNVQGGAAKDGGRFDAKVPPTVTSVSEKHNQQQQSSPSRVDPITALQDSIDRLSLSMFEALRGLRDAVAPESGNLGGSGADGIATAGSSTSSSLSGIGGLARVLLPL